METEQKLYFILFFFIACLMYDYSEKHINMATGE